MHHENTWFSNNLSTFDEEAPPSSSCTKDFTQILSDTLKQAILRSESLPGIRAQIELRTYAAAGTLRDILVNYASLQLAGGGSTQHQRWQPMDIGFVGGKGNGKGKEKGKAVSKENGKHGDESKKKAGDESKKKAGNCRNCAKPGHCVRDCWAKPAKM